MSAYFSYKAAVTGTAGVAELKTLTSGTQTRAEAVLSVGAMF